LASQAQLASILLKKEGPDFFDKNGMWLNSPNEYIIHETFIIISVKHVSTSEMSGIFTKVLTIKCKARVFQCH